MASEDTLGGTGGFLFLVIFLESEIRISEKVSKSVKNTFRIAIFGGSGNGCFGGSRPYPRGGGGGGVAGVALLILPDLYIV